jgi:hypothetical protein
VNLICSIQSEELQNVLGSESLWVLGLQRGRVKTSHIVAFCGGMGLAVQWIERALKALTSKAKPK